MILNNGVSANQHIIYRGLSVLVTGHFVWHIFSAHSGGRGPFLLARDFILLEFWTFIILKPALDTMCQINQIIKEE